MSSTPDRPAHAPMFAHSHDEPEPNAHGVGGVSRWRATVPARQPVQPSGLHRLQGIGGYDGLADAADNADSWP